MWAWIISSVIRFCNCDKHVFIGNLCAQNTLGGFCFTVMKYVFLQRTLLQLTLTIMISFVLQIFIKNKLPVCREHPLRSWLHFIKFSFLSKRFSIISFQVPTSLCIHLLFRRKNRSINSILKVCKVQMDVNKMLKKQTMRETVAKNRWGI